MYSWPIIDAHTHLGDVLNPNGRELIHKTWIPDRNISDRGLKVRDITDPAQWAVWWQFDHGWDSSPIKAGAMKLLNGVNVRASTKRNGAATLENCIVSMDAAGVQYQVTLPIPPYLTFNDVLSANNTRIIPFTGVDFQGIDFAHETENEFADRIEKQLKLDFQNWAKGIKIHPILQVIPLVNKKVYIVMEILSEYNLPMLSHAWHAKYYKLEWTEADKRQAPEHGLDIRAFAELAKKFPQVPIIVWHSGITAVQQVIDQLAALQNVHVDTSFQWQKYIKQLLDSFGEDRVMFASDWPFWARKWQVTNMRRALSWYSDIVSEKVFFWTANRVMQLGL